LGNLAHVFFNKAIRKLGAGASGKANEQGEKEQDKENRADFHKGFSLR
jgi:hypothetical protein